MSQRTPIPDEKIRVMDNGEQKEIPVDQIHRAVREFVDAFVYAMDPVLSALREIVNRYPWNTQYSNNYRKYHGLPMRRKTNRRN